MSPLLIYRRRQKIWSNPVDRKKFLEKIAALGYGKEELENLQKIFDAEDSDILDVLSYLSFMTPTVTREFRVKESESNILKGLGEKQKEFISFVMSKYIDKGFEELDVDKLPGLLNLKYHSISDAEKYLEEWKRSEPLFLIFRGGCI